MEVEVPTNTFYTTDCCHDDGQQSKDCNIEQSTVTFQKDKQCYNKNNEVCHSIMVSGATKLSDQVRRYITIINIFEHLKKHSFINADFSVFNTRILG